VVKRGEGKAARCKKRWRTKRESTNRARQQPLCTPAVANRLPLRPQVRPLCRPASRTRSAVRVLLRARAWPRARSSPPPVVDEWRAVRCRHGVSDRVVGGAGRGGFSRKRVGCLLMRWRRRRGGRRARRRSLPFSGGRHPHVSAAFRSSVALRRCAVSGTSVEGAAAAGVPRQLSMQCVDMVAARPHRPSLRGNQLPLQFRSKAWTAAQNTA